MPRRESDNFSRRESHETYSDSHLSSAPTISGLASSSSFRQAPPHFSDVESPAVGRLQRDLIERKVPSCPNKKSSNLRKGGKGGVSPGPNVSPGMEESDALAQIMPRALGQELEETDAVADLAFDSMQLESPISHPPAAHAGPPPAPQLQMPHVSLADMPNANLSSSLDAAAHDEPAPAPAPAPGAMGPPPAPGRPLRASASFVANDGCGVSGCGEGSSTDLYMESRSSEGGGQTRCSSDAFGHEPSVRKRQKGGSGQRSAGTRLPFGDDSSSERGESSADADAAAMPPPAPLPRPEPSAPERAPPGLARGNSMMDNKVLLTNPIRRTPSYTAPTSSREGFKFEDHFTWYQKLGSGSFSDVYSVSLRRDPTEMFAVKCSKWPFKSRTERAEFLREVELANQMPSHPNVVEYYRAWQEERIFCVQMELCTGGTLRDVMEREGASLRQPGVGERRVWEIILHVCRGLHHIHTYAVIHCDIKPENILVSEHGAFKIGDLGQATYLRNWREENEGDAKYLSKDLLHQQPSFAADIFSFGMILYEITTGEELPGSGAHWEWLRAGDVPPPAQCSVHLQQLVTATMSKEPTERWPAQEILMATAAAMQEMAISAISSAGQHQPAPAPTRNVTHKAAPKLRRPPSYEVANWQGRP